MLSFPEMRLRRIVVGILLCFALGLAMESAVGDRPVGDTVEPVLKDAAGRGLFLLILDSLSVEDAAAMPALQALEVGNFRAEVEPCLERITFMCVQETLTGRSAFSLFGLFRNWGGTGKDPGPNLLRDARAAGRTVAMVTAGDIAAFGPDVDDNEVFKDKYLPQETTRALALAQTRDLVLYHYIWFDTKAHHDPVGSKRYLRARKRMNRVLAQVVAGLPEDMDLIVMGDHGHSEDGRHVQGQDIPTVLVARSPNLMPIRPKGRIPITATRVIAGTIMGIHSPLAERDPSWTTWMSDKVSDAAVALTAQGVAEPPPRFPIEPVLVTAAMVLTTWWVAGPLPAIVVTLAGAALGIGFEPWLNAYHFPGDLPRMHKVSGWLPFGVAILALAWRGSLVSAWRASANSALVLLLLLFPVMHHYGVLKNSPTIAAAVLLPAAVIALVRPGPWRRRILAVLLAAGAFFLIHRLGDVRIFNLEIDRYRGARWFRRQGLAGPMGTAALAAAVQWQIEGQAKPARKVPWALAAGGLASGVLVLHAPVYGLFQLAALVGCFWKGPARGRLLGIGLAGSAPFVYGALKSFGLYGVLAAVAAGLFTLHVAARQSEGEGIPWARSTAVLLLLGGYLTMAFTFGLTVSGIDFSFAISWFPGRWHERLWWVIAIATTLSILLPAALLPEILRGTDTNGSTSGEAGCFAAARLGWMRGALVCTFATTWIVVSGADAAGLRLAGILQDGFFWVLLGAVIGAGWHRGVPVRGSA